MVEIEQPDLRSMHCKVFKRDDGTIRVDASLRPQHWNDNDQWVDVDENPVSLDGKTWSTGSTPYDLSWDAERVQLDFKSKRGGSVTVRLAALDGVPFQPKSVVQALGTKRISAFIAPELEIVLVTRTHGVEIYKILHGPSAPTSLTWEIIEDANSGVVIDAMGTDGWDNSDLSSVSRSKADKLNRRRKIDIQHASTDPVVDKAGRKSYFVTETFTGKTRLIDPRTSARAWVSDISYPVMIDVTVTVSVSADQDDGHGRSTYAYWKANFTSTVGGVWAAAWRFLSVNVPQGQTLDSATLTVNVTAKGGSGGATIKGEATDSAAAWTDTSSHSTASGTTMTTASTAWTVPASTGVKNYDVLTICQEIVNRAGWAANNNIRIGFSDISGLATSGDYAYFEDINTSGADPGKLTIVYTAGGTIVSNPIRCFVAGLGGMSTPSS